MTVAWLSSFSDGCKLAIQVTTNARKSEIADASGELLRIKLQAQPIDGKANEALIQFISKKLHVAKRQITITHGLSSRRKLLEIRLNTHDLDEIEKQLLST